MDLTSAAIAAVTLFILLKTKRVPEPAVILAGGVLGWDPAAVIEVVFGRLRKE